MLKLCFVSFLKSGFLVQQQQITHYEEELQKNTVFLEAKPRVAQSETQTLKNHKMCWNDWALQSIGFPLSIVQRIIFPSS